MDAMELTFPVELASATKLIGSVTVKELEPCNSILPGKTAVHTVGSSETTLWNKIVDTQPPKHINQIPIKHGEASSGGLHNQCKNGLFLTPKSEGLHVERKAGKFLGTGGSCPKRPRVVQLHDPLPVEIDGINDMSQKFGSCTLKCTSLEKPQLAKQKNNICKRGDKRSPRVPVKTKHDSFSVKAGLTCFGSAAGGNNFFGVYGLKSDNLDATTLIDDVPLNELLSGNYQPPNLGKDKGKKPAIGNDIFLNSVRKSCLILQPPKSTQSQNIADFDLCSNKKTSPWLLSTISVEASSVNGDTADSSTIDMSCSSKDISANPLDFPLYQPLDILQRLTLPPPRDLESLLMDATKPQLSSKNNTPAPPDTRSGKQVARRVSLPPFPWSHTSSGHCRANSDVVKLSTIKGTCPGRWLRIGKNITSSFGGNVTSDFIDLDSLTYDRSLVPSGLKVTCLDNDNEISPKISTSLVGHVWDSLASCSKDSCATLVPGCTVTDPGNGLSGQIFSSVECSDDNKHEESDWRRSSTELKLAGNCPKLLAAAQTLYDIAATRPPRQNPDNRLITWPKKSSQKAMKARKVKSNEKTNEQHTTSTSVSVSAPRLENMIRNEEIISLKKPKLSHTTISRRDINYLRNESVSWSTPRSSRSSPGKSVKDSIVVSDTRYPNANVVKQSYMMPPPMRVPESTPNGQLKLRKLMPFEWNRGRDRID